MKKDQQDGEKEHGSVQGSSRRQTAKHSQCCIDIVCMIECELNTSCVPTTMQLSKQYSVSIAIK